MTTRLVASDWLQDRGDPAALAYSEFIRESVRCPKRMSRRAEILLDENLRGWWLRVRPRRAGSRNRRILHEVIVTHATAQRFESFGPVERVLVAGMLDEKEAKRSIQAPMTEYAHREAEKSLSS